jgi:hypothetical protein
MAIASPPSPSDTCDTKCDRRAPPGHSRFLKKAWASRAGKAGHSAGQAGGPSGPRSSVPRLRDRPRFRPAPKSERGIVLRYLGPISLPSIGGRRLLSTVTKIVIACCPQANAAVPQGTVSHVPRSGRGRSRRRASLRFDMTEAAQTLADGVIRQAYKRSPMDDPVSRRFR